MGVRDQVGGVGDVETTPPAVQRLLVGTAVAGGAAWIDHEHVPPSAPPVRDPRPPVDLPLVGRPAVDPDEHPAPARDETPGVERARRIAGGRLDQLRLRELVARPRCGHRVGERRARSTRDPVPHDLRRSSRAAAHSDEVVSHPVEVTVDAAADLVDGPGRRVEHTERAVAALVAGEGQSRAGVIEGERPVPHPPGRSGMFDRFGNHRPIADVHVEPARRIVDVSGLAVRREPRLLDCGIADPPFADRPGSQITVDAHRAVPRHVGRAPCLPRHDPLVGGDRRVEAERVAPVVEPARRRPESRSSNQISASSTT